MVNRCIAFRVFLLTLLGGVAPHDGFPVDESAEAVTTAPPGLTAPVSNVPAAPREGLSLAKAIQLTLLNNRTLEKAGLDRETQRFDLHVSEDEFVPNLHLSSSVLYNPVTRSAHASTRSARRSAT